jgi:ATP-dependent DNA ligase
MSKFYDADLLAVKLGDYRIGTASALRDVNLLPVARLRRRQISHMMVPLDYDTAKRKIAPGTYIISRKIDGEFTCLIYRDGDVVTINPGGTVRTGAPFHAEAAKLLKKAGIKSAILGGELYVRRTDAKRPRVHDVTRIARAPQTEAEVASLQFAVFAIYDLDGVDLFTAPDKALAEARRIFADGNRIHAVDAVEGNEKDVFARFKEWVREEGEEGVVAFSAQMGWYKIKPRHTIDLAVVGFSEGVDERAGMLHSLLLAVVRPDGSFHLVGRAGGGYSEDERVSILEQLTTRIVDSTYTEVNSERVAYKMVQPGVVVEISCLDVIASGSEGQTIDRMVLEWNEMDTRWEGVRRLPLGSIISPQFVRFREDKQATAEHVGIAQLTNIVDIPEVGAKVGDIKLPKADILRRAVATKELKGKTMVRKLLMWKTNKEQVSDEYPAYVLMVTDYSPNRKTPLEREIRVSNNLNQIEAYWAAWEAEYFVKGWVAR